jgi:hypothetical protein
VTPPSRDVSQSDEPSHERHPRAVQEQFKSRSSAEGSKPRPQEQDPSPIASSDTPVPCPREILDADTIAIIADALKVSPAAVQGGLKEFKDFWTIGGGTGRCHTLAKWRAKAREDVRQKAQRGLLVEPEPGPDAPDVDGDQREAERLAREAAYSARQRERLLGDQTKAAS